MIYLSGVLLAQNKISLNDIGIAGTAGFGVGLYPGPLPSGWTSFVGGHDARSDNYGNYQYSDGSICCWIPKFYYRIGSASSPNYATYGNNAIDIASTKDFSDETAANAAGYALHRAFKNGGATKDGFMVDKYQCSKNPSGNIASSIKNGNPLSSSSAHNGFSTIGVTNAYYGAIDAAKTRGSQFHCSSRFQFSALALLSTAHSQSVTSSIYCAWYDGTLVNNFPKGNNNNALGDTNDATVKWESDGYPNCGKTGSAGYGGGTGNFFAKSTHNGQNCGVADLNGNVWEINLGMTRPGANATDSAQQNDASAFYILKESVDVNTLTSGWSNLASGAEAFGDATHLATLYDAITLNHIGNGTGWQYFGSGTNAVLDNSLSGDGYRMTGIGIYTLLGHDGTGINLFGKDGLYEYHRANLCLLSGGYWGSASPAGVWSLNLNSARSYSYSHVGLRCSAYV